MAQLSDVADKNLNGCEQVKALLATARTGFLGTVEPPNGAPFTSLVAIAPGPDLQPILLISSLALHTKNLLADNRVSLLIAPCIGQSDPLAHPRVTMTGRAVKTSDARDMSAYLAHHPAASVYATFEDFGYWRIAVDRAHLIGGFGRIATLSAAEFGWS